jgi:hypothetical protein
MRTTVDIPDETYRRLKILASHQGTTVRQLVLDGLALIALRSRARKKRFELPLIPSTRTDKIDLSNEQIYDLIGFP